MGQKQLYEYRVNWLENGQVQTALLEMTQAEGLQYRRVLINKPGVSNVSITSNGPVRPELQPVMTG